MSKKLNSALSIALGAVLIIISVALKNAMGAYFWIPLVIGLCITVFSAAEFAGLWKKSRGKDADTPDNAEAVAPKPLPEYRRKSCIMTRPEIDAFRLLKELFGDKYEIFPQAALHTVIDKLTQNSYRNELFRVVDFVIADKSTFAPLILIELDDSSHQRADRADRDRKVREICARAGLPLIGFTPADFRDAGYVKTNIKRHMLKR